MPRRYPHLIAARVTADELAEIDRAATALGMSRGELIRVVVLDVAAGRLRQAELLPMVESAP